MDSLTIQLVCVLCECLSAVTHTNRRDLFLCRIILINSPFVSELNIGRSRSVSSSWKTYTIKVTKCVKSVMAKRNREGQETTSVRLVDEDEMNGRSIGGRICFTQNIIEKHTLCDRFG